MKIMSDLIKQITQFFPHKPTSGQHAALRTLSEFLLCGEQESAFLFRGYAGTGKSSLMAALVRYLKSCRQKVVLLAPTGRAARRLTDFSEEKASTIHRCIYRRSASVSTNGTFSLAPNKHRHTFFIVDEASMIALESGESIFGSGRLLDDLIHYIHSGEGCRMLLAGDNAQLPPVGEAFSAALDADYLRGYGLQVFTAELTEVVRQAEESGILWNATHLRKYITAESDAGALKLRTQRFSDVVCLSGSDLIDALGDSYAQEGTNETLVITRSNHHAMRYNLGIRRTILDYEEELCRGDRIMICRNHYAADPENSADFIANGDMVIVRRMRRERELYGFRFADVTFSLPDAPDVERDEVLMLDVLGGESAALSKADSHKLYQAILEDYAHLPRMADRMQAMRRDPYYNALHAKYGYAVTTHKAQGGQWAHVYLDTGFVPPEQLTTEYLRWLYTAITRATKRLYLVNYPESGTDSTEN